MRRSRKRSSKTSSPVGVDGVGEQRLVGADQGQPELEVAGVVASASSSSTSSPPPEPSEMTAFVTGSVVVTGPREYEIAQQLRRSPFPPVAPCSRKSPDARQLTDRVSRRYPASHLRPQRLREGAQMSGRRRRTSSLGSEVREEVGGVDVAHPVVGVRARARRARCARAARWAARGGDGHSGHRTPDAGRSPPWPCGRAGAAAGWPPQQTARSGRRQGDLHGRASPPTSTRSTRSSASRPRRTRCGR